MIATTSSRAALTAGACWCSYDLRFYGTTDEMAAARIEYCTTCTIRTLCQDAADRHAQGMGMWAGTTQRRQR